MYPGRTANTRRTSAKVVRASSEHCRDPTEFILDHYSFICGHSRLSHMLKWPLLCPFPPELFNCINRGVRAPAQGGYFLSPSQFVLINIACPPNITNIFKVTAPTEEPSTASNPIQPTKWHFVNPARGIPRGPCLINGTMLPLLCHWDPPLQPTPSVIACVTMKCHHNWLHKKYKGSTFG